MKKRVMKKKLMLGKETLRRLADEQLLGPYGGSIWTNCSYDCPGPTTGGGICDYDCTTEKTCFC